MERATPGLPTKTLSEEFGGGGFWEPPPRLRAAEELLDDVAQLPEPPLTLDEALPAWTEELLLQLYAITTTTLRHLRFSHQFTYSFDCVLLG